MFEVDARGDTKSFHMDPNWVALFPAKAALLAIGSEPEADDIEQEADQDLRGTEWRPLGRLFNLTRRQKQLSDRRTMERRSGYYAKFSVDVIQRAKALLAARMPEGVEFKDRRTVRHITLRDASWTHDSDPLFFEMYRNTECRHAIYRVSGDAYGLQIEQKREDAWISVEAPDQSTIAEVFEIFESDFETHATARPPDPEEREPPPKVFVGHGGKSAEWMILQNHLRDHHHYQVEAFESGARSGHTIRDILESLVTNASFAILVYTGEDETAAGAKRARQNVVHETGLFQGRLGFNRAIVLHETGVELFSNLDGIQWIGFSPGNIRETFGDVLATLRREFGDRR